MKIILKQTACLQALGHDTRLVVQKRNFDRAAKVLAVDLDGVDVVRLPSSAMWSKLLDTLTANLRNLGGTVLDIDFGALISGGARHLGDARIYAVDALINHSSIAPIFTLLTPFRDNTRRVFFAHDIPVFEMMELENIGPSFLRHAVRKYERYICETHDVVVAATENAARAWRESFGVEVHVVHAGCNPAPQPSLPKTDFFLTVTRWDAARKPEFFLSIGESLTSTGLSLVMAGSWPSPQVLDRFRQEVRARNLEEVIRLRVDPSTPELEELYVGSRAVISPAVPGALIMSALDAACHATPIVFVEKASAWEVFKEGQHGFSFRDVNECVEALTKLRDDRLVESIGRRIWEASKELSWIRQTKRLESLIFNGVRIPAGR